MHELLRTLEDAGWTGAPRFLGIDEHGREVLSWIDGHVPWSGVDEPPSVYDERAVAGVARLVRELHDLTAGSPLAGDGDVVCHNDLSLKNTVYREVSEDGDVTWRPVAFIDWDAAAPGRRIHDVAHLAWQWAANTSSAPESAARLVRVAADAYGLEPADRAELVDTILWWQDRCWRGSRPTSTPVPSRCAASATRARSRPSAPTSSGRCATGPCSMPASRDGVDAATAGP